MPILVMKDTNTGYISANVVLKKGECGHAVNCVDNFLDSLGYKRVVLKVDQEGPIKKLRDAVKQGWAGEMLKEESPIYDSQSA